MASARNTDDLEFLSFFLFHFNIENFTFMNILQYAETLNHHHGQQNSYKFVMMKGGKLFKDFVLCFVAFAALFKSKQLQSSRDQNSLCIVSITDLMHPIRMPAPYVSLFWVIFDVVKPFSILSRY